MPPSGWSTESSSAERIRSTAHGLTGHRANGWAIWVRILVAGIR